MTARIPKAPLRGVLHPALLLTLLTGVLTACSGDSPAPTQPVPTAVSRVRIAPDSAALVIGQTQSFTAQALTAAGDPVSGRTARWSSDKPAVATVDANGLATAAGAGTARITATVDGVAASVSLRVREPAPARVSIAPDSAVVFIGQSQTLTARAFDAAGAELGGRTVRWSTSDAAVVSVTEAGVATGRGAGSATVTATVDGTTATIPVRARENPVKSTSYENFKEVGLTPHSIPLPRTEGWGYHELARGYGDFFGNGRLDMFTSTVDYRLDGSPETAQKAVYRFWRKEGDSYVQDNTVLVPGGVPCLHSRKALVTDFNLDGRPDIFIACTGYDAQPFPGERNQILLSRSDGRYEQREASADVGFWHGAAAADLNSDGYPDVVMVAGGVNAVLLNNRDGTFSRESADRLPDFAGRIYFTVELADVNEDGNVDLLMGGHEREASGHPYTTSATGVWLNPGNGDFSRVDPVVIPAVPGLGVVLDFVITGTGPSRTVWISRTSDGDETFYHGAALQRYDWTTRAAEMVLHENPAHWVPWLISYTRGGTQYVGSDDLRTPMEAAVR